MDGAVNEIDIGITHPDKLFIGGKWVTPGSDRMITVISPVTEHPVIQVAEACEEDVDRAVAAARKAFDEGPWPRMSHAERAEKMRSLAAHAQSRAADLSNAWIEQIGVLAGFAEIITQVGIDTYEFYANLAATFPWEEQRPTVHPGDRGLLIREPVGVVATIAPWNTPFATMAYKVAPALIAGCTIIMKPSPESPLEAFILAECAEAAGLPPGVLNLIPADRDVSDSLVRRPGVDKVSFTGSSAAGKRIASVCGERIARVTLELGGKSAAILLDDFDMAQAAQLLTPSLCLLSGQVCANLSRVLVPRRLQGDLLDALSANLRSIQVGDPRSPQTQMGPLAMRRQLERVQAYIAKGEAEGARLITGGKRPAHLNRGYFIEPTLFGNVDNNMTIAQEEIFGPVTSVIPYDDEAGAIRIANDSSFGLNGAVFTNDDDKAYRIARELRTGTVGQNGFKVDFSIAFGGFKQSGIGREGGVEGLLPYLETKTVVLSSQRLG